MCLESCANPNTIYTPHPEIRICGIHLADSQMTLLMEGQIRHQAVPSLQAFIVSKYCEHNPTSIVLDFNQVHFLDSQGLAFLIYLYKFCHPQGCELSITGASFHIRGLIKLTRLNTFIKLV